ncbi:MAG TPA: UDP-N-acetylmuramate dehydrogenase [bacterium]|nr:UDP-N-acetylmuramate dehydrogenase [bacterium]
MDFEKKLKQLLGNNLKQQAILAPYTSWRIGGPAKYFCHIADLSTLKSVVKLAEDKDRPYFIIGGGSNILVSDRGFDGLVLKLLFNRLKVHPDHCLEVGAGLLLSKAVGQALSSGLSGLEWAAGIPGTVGGAICNNAGAYGGDMSQLVESVQILRQGRIKTIKNKDCRFSYRQSIFREKNQGLILAASLKLQPKDKELIRKKISDILKERKKKFGVGHCVGSVFKNVNLSQLEAQQFAENFPACPKEFIAAQTIPSAWLIDQCDLRGRKIGGAAVSALHAGIINNVGGATAEDVIILISIIKQKVRSRFNLQLREEIEYVGF